MRPVEIEHIHAALKDRLPSWDQLCEHLSDFVAMTLICNASAPELQRCLAGILAEHGWTVVAPDEATPAGALSRERAVTIVDTLAAAVGHANLSTCGDEAPKIAAALAVPEAVVTLAVAGHDGDDLDALAAWWPRKEV